MDYEYKRFAADAGVLLKKLKQSGLPVETVAVEREGIMVSCQEALSDADRMKMDSALFQEMEASGGVVAEQYEKIYWAKVRSFSAGSVRPLRVGRIYRGQEVETNCYVTERIRELYQAGKLAVDDYVLVQFVDGDPDKPIAVEKAYKSW